MSELPRTSIAMATYNGSSFIDAQLRSLALQTRLPDELVVCDDGSSDDTVAKIRAFAAHAPFPVRIVQNGERLGYRANFLQAGQMATGSIVFFCDQDDEWLPEKIATILPLFDDPSVLLAYHNALVTDQAGGELFRLYDDREQLRKTKPADPDPFHHSLGFAQAYRRCLHGFDGFWKLSRDHNFQVTEHLAHDQWFFLLATTLGKIAYSGRQLVRYRQHGTNTYGVAQDGVPRSVFKILSKELAAPAWADHFRSIDAMSRSDIGKAIAEHPACPEHAVARARAIATSYAQLGQFLERRYASCYHVAMGRRMAALWTNIRHKAYAGGSNWRFRLGWLAGDMVRAARGCRLSDASQSALIST